MKGFYKEHTLANVRTYTLFKQLRPHPGQCAHKLCSLLVCLFFVVILTAICVCACECVFMSVFIFFVMICKVICVRVSTCSHSFIQI